ncbi:MAG: hypothetical protein WB493_16295 [Anaeromyxobacteraceae bacterium]
MTTNGSRQAGNIDARRSTAMRAGAWYLVIESGTAFGMGSLDRLLLASGEGAVATSVIRSSSALHRAGFTSTAVGVVAMPFLAGLPYDLLESFGLLRPRRRSSHAS